VYDITRFGRVSFESIPSERKGEKLTHIPNSRDSYNHISSWLSDARSLANPDIVIILVGNKSDLEAEREVTFLEASRFSQENGSIHDLLLSTRCWDLRF